MVTFNGGKDLSKIATTSNPVPVEAVGIPGLTIAKGEVDGHSSVHKFGQNPSIDTGTSPETIWVVGGIYVFPSDSGEGLEIVSDDIGDTEEVKVIGLDEDFLEKEEIITLNGTTPVNLSGLWTRVNRAFNNNGNLLLGNIDIRDQASSLIIFARMRTEEQQTSQIVFTIPSDKVGFWTQYQVTMNKGSSNSGAADVISSIRDFGKTFREIEHRGVISTGNSIVVEKFTTPIPLRPKTDFKIDVSVDTNGLSLAGCADFILVDSDLLDLTKIDFD